MEKEQADYVVMAIHMAKQVLHIFERDYPDDIRPANAIKAAEAWVSNRSLAMSEIANAMAGEAKDAAWKAKRSLLDTGKMTYGAMYAAYAAESAALSAAYDFRYLDKQEWDLWTRSCVRHADMLAKSAIKEDREQHPEQYSGE